MPLDPKMIEALFAPGAGVRMHNQPLIDRDRAFTRGRRPNTRRQPYRAPRPHLRGISHGGREYHGRTVRQWGRLWGLDPNIMSWPVWDNKVRLFFERGGDPDQFLTHARLGVGTNET